MCQCLFHTRQCGRRIWNSIITLILGKNVYRRCHSSNSGLDKIWEICINRSFGALPVTWRVQTVCVKELGCAKNLCSSTAFKLMFFEDSSAFGRKRLWLWSCLFWSLFSVLDNVHISYKMSMIITFCKRPLIAEGFAGTVFIFVMVTVKKPNWSFERDQSVTCVLQLQYFSPSTSILSWRSSLIQDQGWLIMGVCLGLIRWAEGLYLILLT